MTVRLPIAPHIREAALLRTDSVCWYCGDDVTGPRFHIDHLLPVCQGGTNDLANLVPTCPTCNMSKNGQTVEEYRVTIERKLSKIPYFNPPQVAFLKSHGFDIESHRTTGHRFYFEIHNLEERPLPTPVEP